MLSRDAIRSIGLVSIILLSMVGAGAGVVSAQSGPGNAPDHAAVGSVEVVDRSGPGGGPPSSAGPPSDAAAWDVSASKHAGDMQAEIIVDDDRLRGLVVTDDVNHEGREISISLDALESSVDEIPDEVSGINSEAGDRWTSDVRIDGDRVVVDVPQFSTNTITFSSQISINADPAADGDQFSYEIADTDDVNNLNLELTGSDSTNSREISLAEAGDNNITVDIDGSESVDISANISAVDADGSLSESRSLSDTISVNGLHGTVIDKQSDILYYVGSGFETVIAYDLTDDHTEWTYDTAGNTIRSIEIDSVTDTLYYGTTSSGIGAISAGTSGGSSLWTIGSGSIGDYVDALVVDETTGTLYAGDGNADVYAIDGDPDTGGSDYWIYDSLDGGVSSLALDQSTTTVYAADDNADIHALDGDTATTPGQDWSYTAPGEIESIGVDESTGDVYLGGDFTKLISLDVDGTLLWESDTYETPTNEAPFINVDQDREMVYAATHDFGSGSIQAVDISPDNPGSIKWHYDLSDDASGVSLNDQSGLLYTGNGSDIISLDTIGEAVDPTVNIGGQTVVSQSGALAGGDSKTGSISLSPGSYEGVVSTSDGQVDVSVDWMETTKTIDPKITITSDKGTQTVSHTGTISNGSTVDLSDSIDPSLIGGNVSLGLSVSGSVDGPIGQVGLDYSHAAQETRTIDYQGEEFSERYSFTRQWQLDRPSASIKIPWASDRVVDVRSVQVDGVQHSDYDVVDGDLVINLGSVQTGEQTNVTAVGSKVSVTGGTISVSQPTTQGEELDSEIVVESLSSEMLQIDVSGSYHVSERDRMIYSTDDMTSWTGSDPITRIEPGSQSIEVDPVEGSTMRLRSAAVGSEIDSGDAVIRMVDPDEPRISVSEGQTSGDVLRLTYHDTVSGDWYRVIDPDGQTVLDTDQAQSPAEFRVSDTSGLLSIETYVPESVVDFVGGGGGSSSDSGLIPPWLLLIVSVGGTFAGMAYVSTRTSIGQSTTGRRILLGGVPIIGYVAAELVSGPDLYQIALDWLSGVLLGVIGASGSAGEGLIGLLIDSVSGLGFASLVLGIVALVGLYAIDQRSEIDIPREGWVVGFAMIGVWFLSNVGPELLGVPIDSAEALTVILSILVPLGLVAIDQRDILDIPIPLYIGTAVILGIYVLETLSPGGILGPLTDGLDEVGPLVWLFILGGGGLLIYFWLRSRRPEIVIGPRGGGGQP